MIIYLIYNILYQQQFKQQCIIITINSKFISTYSNSFTKLYDHYLQFLSQKLDDTIINDEIYEELSKSFNITLLYIKVYIK